MDEWKNGRTNEKTNERLTGSAVCAGTACRFKVALQIAKADAVAAHIFAAASKVATIKVDESGNCGARAVIRLARGIKAVACFQVVVVAVFGLAPAAPIATLNEFYQIAVAALQHEFVSCLWVLRQHVRPVA